VVDGERCHICHNAPFGELGCDIRRSLANRAAMSFEARARDLAVFHAGVHGDHIAAARIGPPGMQRGRCKSAASKWRLVAIEDVLDVHAASSFSRSFSGITWRA
jgi:hypothetical protein